MLSKFKSLEAPIPEKQGRAGTERGLLGFVGRKVFERPKVWTCAEGDDRKPVFDHLNSPFGVALVGNDLYVANTDSIVRYPYDAGDTKITAVAKTLTPLPGGPIDHHWTKSLVASKDGSLLYVGVGSNSNITENGMQAEKTWSRKQSSRTMR